jgi:hypothetical protein
MSEFEAKVEANSFGWVDSKARGSLAYDEAFCVVKDFVCLLCWLAS